MGDDLVKRMRDTPNWMREGFQDWKDNVRTYDRAPFEAADRIEELEAKLTTCEKYRDAYAECDRIGTQAVRDLEAKLAKALDALEVGIAKHNGAEKFLKVARTTLAELTGGKDE